MIGIIEICDTIGIYLGCLEMVLEDALFYPPDERSVMLLLRSCSPSLADRPGF